MHRLVGLVVILALTFPGSAKAQELLFNPGFEDLGGGVGEGWGSFGAAGFHTFFGPNAHASLFADNVGNSGGVFQTGIAGSAGQQYEFVLTDTRIEAEFDANLLFGLEFFQADDSTQISNVLQNIPDPGVEVNGGVYSMTAVAPAGTEFVRPIIRFDSVGSSGGQRNVFVFDASLTAIPEPGSLLLTGCLGLCCLVRRRHSSSFTFQSQ